MANENNVVPNESEEVHILLQELFTTENNQVLIYVLIRALYLAQNLVFIDHLP